MLRATTQHPEGHILRQHQPCHPDRPVIPCAPVFPYAHVFPRRAEESDVSLPLNMTRVAPTACRPLPCHPDRLSFLAHLSSRAKRGNLHINNLRGEIRRAGYEHFCFYFSSLYILCITLPPVKTIILTASIEKSSASTINGLSSLPSARTL